MFTTKNSSGSRAHSRQPSAQSIIVKETTHINKEANDDIEMIERRLNQYLILKTLGEGSFATVSLAVDTKTNTQYAIKEISKSRMKKLKRQKFPFSPQKSALLNVQQPSNASIGTGEIPTRNYSNDDGLDAIRKEIAILKKLNHPNVIKLYEVLNDPEHDLLYMVFELCSKGPVMKVSMVVESNNGTLDTIDDEQHPAPKILEEPIARKFFRQLILGLEYLHERHGIAHCDLKPENLLLDQEGVLKIVDFGVSEVQNQPFQLFSSNGTPAFLPPERLTKSQEVVDLKKCDIWSAGICLYCFVCGALPFQAPSLPELYQKIQTAPLEIPSNLNPGLKDLLSKLLTKNPLQRIILDEIREHPWITNNNTEPLLAKEENLNDEIDKCVTDQELSGAFTLIQKVKGFVKKLRHSRQSSQISQTSINE